MSRFARIVIWLVAFATLTLPGSVAAQASWQAIADPNGLFIVYVPTSWFTEQVGGQARAASPDADVIVILQADKGTDTRAGRTQEGLAAFVQSMGNDFRSGSARPQSTTVNGLEMTYTEGTAIIDGAEWGAVVAVFADPDDVTWGVLFIVYKPDSFQQSRQTLNQILSSLDTVD